jgi:hypothetical protein
MTEPQTTAKKQCDSYLSYLSNKRKTVFSELEKNPLLTAKTLAQIIEIPITERKKEYPYLKKLKYDWKSHHINERGSIRSCPDGVHNAFFRGKLSLGFLRCDLWVVVLPFGWRATRNRNRCLLFVSGLGRVRFFRSGTVEVFVRKPASVGKCMQLFCDAFTKTGLVDSIKVVEDFQEGLMRRMHVTFDTGVRQPYMKITAFEDTHGFTFVSGDRTHRTCFEFMFEYHAEVEAARRLFEQFAGFLGDVGKASKLNLEQDYSR